jgi:hypothetical protein
MHFSLVAAADQRPGVQAAGARAASSEADTLIDPALAARLWCDTLQPWALRSSIVALCGLKAAAPLPAPGETRCDDESHTCAGLQEIELEVQRTMRRTNSGNVCQSNSAHWAAVF